MNGRRVPCILMIANVIAVPGPVERFKAPAWIDGQRYPEASQEI